MECGHSQRLPLRPCNDSHVLRRVRNCRRHYYYCYYPNFLATPSGTGKAKNFKFCTHIHRSIGTKAHKNLRKV